jgi:hypothetical protein
MKEFFRDKWGLTIIIVSNELSNSFIKARFKDFIYVDDLSNKKFEENYYFTITETPSDYKRIIFGNICESNIVMIVKSKNFQNKLSTNLPSRLVYQATLILGFKNGELTVIKNRFLESDTDYIIENLNIRKFRKKNLDKLIEKL